MKSLGVIGGLGPMATAYFLELTVRMTDAARDQDHLEVTILDRPSIPDRTACILGRSKESPVPMMEKAAKTLEALGASCIAVPCVTSHYFFEELQKSVRIPFIHLVRETAAHLKENGVSSAGILATSGTVATGLFQKALEAEGISWHIPDAGGQEKVMHLIYENVKAGLPPELHRAFLNQAGFPRRPRLPGRPGSAGQTLHRILRKTPAAGLYLFDYPVTVAKELL